MTTSSTLQIIMTDKNYHQIAINMFQGYANERFEGKFFWRFMKIDFKYWTKKYCDILNGKT